MVFLLWGAVVPRFGSSPVPAGDFLVLEEKLAGRETFLEKGSPSPCPSLPKTFVGESAQGWKVRGAAGLAVTLGKTI